MKSSRIAALALIACASFGFNAYAGDTSEFTPHVTETFVSTLTRAQVQAEAIQANLEKSKRGYNDEQDVYLVSAPAQAETTLTRQAVRAEALAARSKNIAVESNS